MGIMSRHRELCWVITLIVTAFAIVGNALPTREISTRACNPDREQCECKAYAKGHGCVEWGYPSNPYIMGRKEENDVAREISSRACDPDREQCECKAYAKGHGCVEWGYPSNP